MGLQLLASQQQLQSPLQHHVQVRFPAVGRCRRGLRRKQRGEHDQTTAEQFYATYGYYPSWYSNMYTATPILRQAQVKTIADAPVFRTAGINTINTLGYTGYPYTSWPYTGYYNYPMTYSYL